MSRIVTAANVGRLFFPQSKSLGIDRGEYSVAMLPVLSAAVSLVFACFSRDFLRFWVEVRKFVNEPINQPLKGQCADPSVVGGVRLPRQDFRQHYPDLAEQVGDSLQQQSIDRVPAGRAGLSLVFLPVTRFDPEAAPVQAATLERFFVNVAGAVPAPALEGEQHRLEAALPEEG